MVLLVNTNGAKHHTKYCRCKINLLLEKSCSTKNNLIKCLLFTKSTQYYLFKIKSVNKSLNRLLLLLFFFGGGEYKSHLQFLRGGLLTISFSKKSMHQHYRFRKEQWCVVPDLAHDGQSCQTPSHNVPHCPVTLQEDAAHAREQ